MRQLCLFLFVLICFSCKTKKTFKHPLLQNTDKPYVEINKITADEMHRHFSLNIPDNWSIYFDVHNIIMYSPLGTKFKKRIKINELTDSVFQEKKAKDIFEHNKANPDKKGYYWKSYLTAFSVKKDSLKLKNHDDVIQEFLKSRNALYNNNFKYILVKEKHHRHGQILYFKYDTEWNFSKISHIDAIILGKKRVYYLNFRANFPYYKYYVDDVVEIVKTIEIKE